MTTEIIEFSYIALVKRDFKKILAHNYDTHGIKPRLMDREYF